MINVRVRKFNEASAVYIGDISTTSVVMLTPKPQ